MAGTVHEVENHALLAEVEREAANAAQELVDGHQVGSWSTPEAAQAIFRGLQSVFAPRGVYLAAQCCEHLNRALIVEHEAVPNAEIVNVLPQPKAGSSFATAAYESFRHPVALEEIRADAGLDIGGTLIGMHLKKVAVPVRLKQDHIGQAIVLALSRCFFAALFTSCGRSARRFPRRARACCRRAGRRAGSLSRSASPLRSGGSA